ncbi:MAG: methyltransferase domain-containing protein [Muribaculaceae bacterium]|nr:methyltransferase domain-containing protein [Muribaculaceae bacterium]
MKILPVSYRNFQPYNKTKNSPNFTSDSKNIVRTTEPELNNYINVLSSKYKVSAHIQFFLDALNKIKTSGSGIKNITDIGCCDGMLTRTISKYLDKDVKFYGCDLSEEMLDIARNEDKKAGINSVYQVANAFTLPYENNSMDAMILSSIMHELYSYASPEFGEKEYSKDSILHFMQKAYEILKAGGVLIIKDPATCDENYNDTVRFSNINKEDGEVPFIKDKKSLINADVTKLCSLNKLQRFCMEFKPAQGFIKWENEDCIMPKWLVTEFLRQRKCIRTPEYWAYEIKERYGTMRPEEMRNFAKQVGFDVLKAENLSISNRVNEYAIRDDEFTIYDNNGKKLTFEDFPMFLQVVLRKPQK